MKKIIFKILLRLYSGKSHYNILGKGEVDSLLIRLSKEEGFERLPDFLRQCEDQFKNQYLYSGQEMFKGAVLAFTQLREQILEKKDLQKKKLTNAEKNVTIKQGTY